MQWVRVPAILLPALPALYAAHLQGTMPAGSQEEGLYPDQDIGGVRKMWPFTNPIKEEEPEEEYVWTIVTQRSISLHERYEVGPWFVSKRYFQPEDLPLIFPDRASVSKFLLDNWDCIQKKFPKAVKSDAVIAYEHDRFFESLKVGRGP